MKKWIVLLLVAAGLISCITYSRNHLKKAETNLEFWIGENVQDVDFSAYQKKYRSGYMGPGTQYYGTSYVPQTDEEGNQIDPEHYVIYTVSAFPDVLSKKAHITEITITDPAVNVYGLTFNSSAEDIQETMQDYGFKSAAYGNLGKTEWVKGKFHVRFFESGIYLHVDVGNHMQIAF